MNEADIEQLWRELRDGTCEDGVAKLSYLYSKIEQLTKELADAKAKGSPERGHSDR